jgi:hypothetical protein
MVAIKSLKQDEKKLQQLKNPKNLHNKKKSYEIQQFMLYIT